MKSRLKQIEKKLNSNYCDCSTVGKIEADNLELMMIGDVEVMFPAEVRIDPNDLKIKDFCDNCRKLIDKERVKNEHREFMKLFGL